MADDQRLLKDLASTNADIRFAAWRSAGDASPSVVPAVGKLAASTDPGIAKAAREALATMVHAVGADSAAPNRSALVKELLALTDKSVDNSVRIHAFRLLSNIAPEDAVSALAKYLKEEAVQEEAIFAIEQIPGPTSEKELIAAFASVNDGFKPRILAALGHRRSKDAAGLCTTAMQSPDKEIAVAATKAFGRIGRRASAAPRPPEERGLSVWQQIDVSDAMLRFADGQAKEGNHAEAIRLYTLSLNRPEEHWQCAGVIGLAKIGTADAATAILPKLKSENSKVRITAEKAWKSIATSRSA